MPRRPKSKNITWHAGSVTAADRERRLGQRGCVVWLTGLSGSGKSTVARALEARLAAAGRAVYVLDGDNVRHGLNADLGFSPADRRENIRRIGRVAALMADAGLIAICAFVSPYRAGRRAARAAVPRGRFIEVFADAPIDVCRARDPKGLYRKAAAGRVAQLTGVDAPYERPRRPELVLKTACLGVETCAAAVLRELGRRRLLKPPPGPRRRHAGRRTP